MKKSTFLSVLLVMLMSASPPLFAVQHLTPVPNASAAVTLALLTVENINWTSALDITRAIPDASGGSVRVVATNCTGAGPLLTYDLKAGELRHSSEFGASQCGVNNYGVTNVTVSGGSATLHTAATFTDTSTGQKSQIDVPVLSDPLPKSPTAYASVERMSNGVNGRSQFFGLFAKGPATFVTILVYDDKGVKIGDELVSVDKATFYGLKTKVGFGRAEIYNGTHGFGCPGCDPQSEVYVVQFDGYLNGGSPRVEVPPIIRP